MINLCNTLLPNDRVHAIRADIGKIIKPIPIIDRVIEVDVAAIISIVSTDSNIVLSFLIFIFLFGFVIFAFEINYLFFNIVNLVIKTIYII